MYCEGRLQFRLHPFNFDLLLFVGPLVCSYFGLPGRIFNPWFVVLRATNQTSLTSFIFIHIQSRRHAHHHCRGFPTLGRKQNFAEWAEEVCEHYLRHVGSPFRHSPSRASGIKDAEVCGGQRQLLVGGLALSDLWGAKLPPWQFRAKKRVAASVSETSILQGTPCTSGNSTTSSSTTLVNFTARFQS